MNYQPQAPWVYILARVFLFTASGVGSLFGILSLSFPLWGHSFLFGPSEHYPDLLDMNCITALSYPLPILISLFSLIIVVLGLIGLRRGLTILVAIAGGVSFFLCFFFLCSPVWGYIVIWGDGYLSTGCEHFIEQWFPTVGPWVGIVLTALNLLAFWLLPKKKPLP